MIEVGKEIRDRRFNFDVPERCTLHQVVKQAYDESDTSRRCIVCKHYHKSLKCDTCFDCLGTEHLDNFAPNKDVINADWYLAIQKEEREKNFPAVAAC